MDHEAQVPHGETQQARHLLILKDPEDADGCRLIPLEASSHSMGRAPTNSIVIPSKAVSRQHGLLLRVTSSDPSQYSFLMIDGDLRGQRSTNGIKVNGKKCSSQRLRHGDQILFSNQVKAKYLKTPALTTAEFQAYCQTLNLEALLEDFGHDHTGGTHTGSLTLEQGSDPSSFLDEASLVRLASFPEIIPSPMFEVNLNGELTYLNPAAASSFPDLSIMGMRHPTLKGLMTLIKESERNILTREVQVGAKVFEQSIHYIHESELVRCCVFDITERKYAETELRMRDRLLQGVAEATTHLLANAAYDDAIDKALATLGEAARIDRICISQNHPHPEGGAIATSLRFEWVRESIEPLRHQSHRQNQLFSGDYLKRWYHDLTDERAIQGIRRHLPEAEQAYLARSGILSVLAVPIIINHDFWGFIELDNCTTEYEWSIQEESIVFAMAASIAAALQRQQTEEIIHHQAFHDALTDLPNRILFNDRLQIALAAAQRQGHHLAVMFMDLDRFKTINDTLGHSTGDTLLKAVTQRLKTCLRDGDTLARWGGDEFTVLLPQIESVEDALTIGHRILEALKEPFLVATHELYISASIGISLAPDDGDVAELLLQNADVALYRSKEQGRGTCQLYNPTMNSKAPELFVLENNLRHAIARDELLLYYQPKVNITTGAIIGLEALVRWEHPEMGLVSPATFIPLAEETGLIIEVGEWVLRRACYQTVAWHQAGLTPLTVAVNLSARQFFQPQIVEIIADVLRETQLPPSSLELEITETTAVKNMDFTRSVLTQLQAMGVKIAMDDFGTGYSSLNYLKQLPLDTLKIDQSFIRELKPNSADAKIVNAVISLGLGLDLHVVAEGVDNPQQLELLRSLQCDIVQGYLFSRPLPEPTMTPMLQTNWAQRGQPWQFPMVLSA
ncbi:EAL domain-containing protein [Synechococcales cyanobacterium C]|uniref:EAL domain-containing protein n=1 Tax=Petrachloros mirabilis ULC683 TaxID=2781853 RepID=A0A8K1ZZI8_9CYAN|nr:EAL domain-containing protein [Petrachloros mirabilis]NCJ06973.1 EAL domain-containing protein [Petrachloros mirabilis ULC683]